MMRWLTPLLGLCLLAACGPLSPDSPANSLTPDSLPAYAPQPGDDRLLRGEVYLDSAEILALESFPVQYSVLLKGSLPTPCHAPRIVVHEADAQNRIELEVYSVVDPDQVCVQVLEAFEQNVYLGSFPPGHYSLWTDERLLAEFDA